MGNHITLQARAALRGGFIALGMLAFAHCAPATENSPRMPPEQEPATWQRAGLEAALTDPDFVVQYHALDYCLRKKWVVQLHFSTEQWLHWLGHENSEVKALAAEAAGQLGAQMPAELQRTLARLRKSADADPLVQHAAARALLPLGAGMIPEVQLELVTALQETPPDYDLLLQYSQALGQTGAAMAPTTLEALLALMEDTQTAADAGAYAADALARLGLHMPPQVRELMLGLLLDSRAGNTLRGTAADAMGRLGPQMPPQAWQLFLSALRDPGADRHLRDAAPTALAQLGPPMPPEVQQALLTAYAEPPPAKADEDARTYHPLFHAQAALALELAGPDMPPALQQALLDRFLKAAHSPQAQLPPADDFVAMVESDLPGAELHILAKAGAHASPAVLHALLTEFQSTAASEATRESIAEYFFQPLAARGTLPAEVQRVLLACVQDEKASLQARSLAVQTLGHLGADTRPEAKQALLVVLQNKVLDDDLRFSALQAMERLGPHMPPEAAPVLVGILQKNIASCAVRPSAPSPAAPSPAAPNAAPAPAPAADPFGPSAAPAPAGNIPPAESPPALARVHTAAPVFSMMPDGFPIEHAVPALGNLGEKMPPEAQSALLGVIQHQAGLHQTPWDAAFSLARMGDKLPPQTQQSLLDLLRQPELDSNIVLAIRRALGVSGIHPVSDAQLTDLLAKTYEGEPDTELRFYLYLWLGRSPAQLQAVRWLGQTNTDPPLGDTSPQEILSLISRLWPHSAAHPALRLGLARRTSQIITTHLKNRPLDEATQKVLRPLATQLAGDPAADCVTSLQHVRAALTADEKAR